MTKVLIKVNNKVMATDGKLLTGEKQEGTLLKPILDATKSAYYLFENYPNDDLSDLIQYNDTENVTNFSYMYYQCKKATSVPLINTSNGTDFSFMYANCFKATSLPQIDTSLGNNFSNMFRGCNSATSLPQLDTSNGTDFNNMYNDCHKLEKIDISKFTCSSTSYSSQMFVTCRLLKAVIIRSFGETYVLNSNAFNNCYWMKGTTSTIYNPNGEYGYIYVPRDMIETLKVATNWSTYADQIRALEDYTDDGTTTGKFLDEKAGL